MEEYSRPLRFPVAKPCQSQLTTIVERVLQVAGDLPRHITMPSSGPCKYVERPNAVYPDPAPVTTELVHRHLEGSITLGSYLLHSNGLTLAVCWDADSPDRWDTLLAAGRELLLSGAKPIAERSPAKGAHAGGGHLWLVFRQPVDPRAARATAEKYALELTDFPEFWPRAGAVRLIGGFYRRAETSAWCQAAALRAPEEWVSSWEAGALTLSEATPSSWATEAAPSAQEEGCFRTPSVELDTREMASPAQPEPEAWDDVEWVAKYGAARRSLSWAVLPKHAINWFNSLHDVRTILPKQPNGYALATWRAERTASVAYVPDNRWRDYGANRTQPGGDAFEAYALVTHGEGRRNQALADIFRQMTSAAQRELENAARAGRGVPAWVAEIMGPVGWERYECRRISESGKRASAAYKGL